MDEEMHLRCIIYKCYILQHLDICLFVKAIADISWWKIKKNKSWATGKEAMFHLTQQSQQLQIHYWKIKSSLKRALLHQNQ